MVFIKTIVSPDRLDEAVSSIKRTLDTVIDDISEEELASARNALINSMVDNFETDRSMAVAFITMARYKLPPTYFDTRAQEFEKITLDQVKEAARKVLSGDKLILFRVGRVK